MKLMLWQLKEAMKSNNIIINIVYRTSVSDRALCQLLNEMDGVESRA